MSCWPISENNFLKRQYALHPPSHLQPPQELSPPTPLESSTQLKRGTLSPFFDTLTLIFFRHVEFAPGKPVPEDGLCVVGVRSWDVVRDPSVALLNAAQGSRRLSEALKFTG